MRHIWALDDCCTNDIDLIAFKQKHMFRTAKLDRYEILYCCV